MNTLEEKVNAGIKEAMRAKEDAALRGLRAIKQALLLAKTSGQATLAAEDEIKMLQKLVKQRKESIEIYEKQNRPDLAEPEKQEIAVIEKFLPQMMSEAEIADALKKIIDTIGASSPSDMGKVMGAASKQLAGKADNKLVSQIVKQLLTG